MSEIFRRIDRKSATAVACIASQTQTHASRKEQEVAMIIKACLTCKFHEMKQDGKEEMSHCRRENCWSRYSKCVLDKALQKFLKEESSREDQSRSSF